MSVTITPVGTGPFAKSWNITASADNDDAAVITHGFLNHYAPVAPALVFLTPLQPSFYNKKWLLGAVNTTVINLAATSFTGGGLAGTPQLQVVALLPQSIMD